MACGAATERAPPWAYRRGLRRPAAGREDCEDDRLGLRWIGRRLSARDCERWLPLPSRLADDQADGRQRLHVLRKPVVERGDHAGTRAPLVGPIVRNLVRSLGEAAAACARPQSQLRQAAALRARWR